METLMTNNMLYDTLRADLTTAMKARDELRVTVLRGLLAAFTNEAIAKKRKPDERLSEEEMIDVMRRAVKQRKDSIEQFRKGGRMDLVANEEAELKVIQRYLPQMMSQDEILPVAEAKKAELGASDKSEAGKLVGAIMAELKGKADGADVKVVVDSLLA